MRHENIAKEVQQQLTINGNELVAIQLAEERSKNAAAKLADIEMELNALTNDLEVHENET